MRTIWALYVCILPTVSCFFQTYVPMMKLKKAVSSYIPNVIEKNRFEKITFGSNHNSTNSNNPISIVFLPGSLVDPREYTKFLETLKDVCETNGIDTNIYNTKFTCNIMHRWETDDVSNDILTQIPRDHGLVIIGHSGGGFTAVDVAEKVSADCVVQWAGTLNSMGDLPWDSRSAEDLSVPRYTLLSEYDKRIPFPLAIKEFCLNKNNNSLVSFLEGGYHFSGIKEGSKENNTAMTYIGKEYELRRGKTNLYTLEAAWKISEFISSAMLIGTSPDTATRYLQSDHTRVLERFMSLSKGQTRYEISTDIETIAAFKLGIPTKIKNFHISVPGDMLMTFLYIGVHPLRPIIHTCMLLSSFIFSHPDSSSGESYSYSPLPDCNPFAVIRSPPTWVKLDGIDKNLTNRARLMNTEIFNSALKSVSPDQKRRYVKYGRKMVFGEDIVIPPIPGCGLLWILSPILMNLGYSKKKLCVHSPVLNVGSRMNAKIVNKSSCIEWISTACFENK